MMLHYVKWWHMMSHDIIVYVNPGFINSVIGVLPHEIQWTPLIDKLFYSSVALLTSVYIIYIITYYIYLTWKEALVFPLRKLKKVQMGGHNPLKLHYIQERPIKPKRFATPYINRTHNFLWWGVESSTSIRLA